LFAKRALDAARITKKIIPFFMVSSIVLINRTII